MSSIPTNGQIWPRAAKFSFKQKLQFGPSWRVPVFLFSKISPPPPPLPLLLRHPPAELLEEEGGGRLVVLQGQSHRVASLLNRDVEV